MTTDRLIALAIVLLALAPVALIVFRNRVRVAWFSVRLWLADAHCYLTDRLRGRGCGTGLHVLPAGETPEDLPDPDTLATRNTHSRAGELEPLPEYDEGIAIRERYRRLAWAATGTTEDAWRAQQDRVDDLVAVFAATGNLPGAVTHREVIGNRAPTGSAPVPSRAGEPTNASMGNWTPRELAPHVVAALTNARPDETVIDGRLTPADATIYAEHLAGGALDDRYWARWDGIEARAREVLARIPVSA